MMHVLSIGLVEEEGREQLLVVDLPASQHVETGLSEEQLNERVDSALQRFASGRLDNYKPVLEQTADGDSPIV